MSQLTWYILESLDEFLTYLKKYAQSIDESIFIIHSLAIYEDQIQKLGREKFTTHGQILEYMDSRISDLIFLESGEISTIQSDNLKSKNSYFIAQINP
jgi:ATP adenylyltransferase/5',5'''-P-1,P-4-tetraphosphate phosphorylase II